MIEGLCQRLYKSTLANWNILKIGFKLYLTSQVGLFTFRKMRFLTKIMAYLVIWVMGFYSVSFLGRFLQFLDSILFSVLILAMSNSCVFSFTLDNHSCKFKYSYTHVSASNHRRLITNRSEESVNLCIWFLSNGFN